MSEDPMNESIAAPKVDHVELVREARIYASLLAGRGPHLITRLADALGEQDRSPLPPALGDLADVLTMTGCRDRADLEDMANVGKSLLDAIASLVSCPGPFHGWQPMDDPAEIVTDLQNALDEALASQPQGTPPGWKLVPIEPTEAMVCAGDGKDPGFGSLSARVYTAMIAAAPSPADAREGNGARIIRGLQEAVDIARGEDQPGRVSVIKVGAPMPYFCPACQAIPQAGYCKLAGCPTAPSPAREGGE